MPLCIGCAGSRRNRAVVPAPSNRSAADLILDRSEVVRGICPPSLLRSGRRGPCRISQSWDGELPPSWSPRARAWTAGRRGPTAADGVRRERLLSLRRFRNHRIRVLLYAGRPNWELPTCPGTPGGSTTRRRTALRATARATSRAILSIMDDEHTTTPASARTTESCDRVRIRRTRLRGRGRGPAGIPRPGAVVTETLAVPHPTETAAPQDTYTSVLPAVSRDAAAGLRRLLPGSPAPSGFHDLGPWPRSCCPGSCPPSRQWSGRRGLPC